MSGIIIHGLLIFINEGLDYSVWVTDMVTVYNYVG